jgi:glutaminyl-peptide cyclotransferase
MRICACLWMLWWLTDCVGAAGPLEPRALDWAIMAVLPHNPKSFTQGLVLADSSPTEGSEPPWLSSVLIEGSGQFGSSRLFKYFAGNNSELIGSVGLPSNLFGEGVCVLGSRVYQLNWLSPPVMLWSVDNFASQGQLVNPLRQGWGITADTETQQLVISDGSSTLSICDPQSLRIQRQVQVRLRGQPLRDLNELEFVPGGTVLANVWHQNWIVQISLQTGEVLAVANMTGMRPGWDSRNTEEVLNGIAVDSRSRLVYLTGKYWPMTYVVRMDGLWTTKSAQRSDAFRKESQSWVY